MNDDTHICYLRVLCVMEACCLEARATQRPPLAKQSLCMLMLASD